jgi:hypothetical protein
MTPDQEIAIRARELTAEIDEQAIPRPPGFNRWLQIKLDDFATFVKKQTSREMRERGY